MANVNTLRFSVKGSSGYLLKILLKAIVEDVVNLLTMTIIRAGHHDNCCFIFLATEGAFTSPHVPG